MKNKIILGLSLFAIGLLQADDLCMPQNGLQVWFRADRAINTQPGDPAVTYGGTVSNWSSCCGATTLMTAATNASVAPLYNPNSFLRTDGSFYPGVRFSRDINNTITLGTFLQSTAPTAFSITRSNTWFVVCRPLLNMSQTCLFGSINNGSRFGAFYVGSPSTNILRVHNGNSSIAMQMLVPINRTGIIDSRRTDANTDATLNGQFQCSATGQTTTMVADYFRIGHMLDGVTGKFIGDIAEVVVYNRSVSDAERLIIQNSLAARSGAELDPASNFYAASLGTSNGCVYGVTGIGRYTAAINPNSTPVEQSENSDGLQLSARNGSLDQAGEFLMCGYRGRVIQWQAKRLTREWFLQKTSANGLDARLIFNATTPAGTVAHLYFKAMLHDDYIAVPVAASATESTTTFDLDNSMLQSGFYTLGYDDERIPDDAPFMAEGLSTFFRADRNVQTSNGFVTAWSSCYGSELQTTPSEITNCPSWIAAAFVVNTNDAEPAVRFSYEGGTLLTNRTHLLWSTEKTTLGITGLQASVFVVGRHMAIDKDIGIFGLDNLSYRLGMFFTTDSGGSVSSVQQWFSLNSGSPYRPISKVRKDQVFILDGGYRPFDASQRCVVAYNQGQAVALSNVNTYFSAPVPLLERFLIGTHLRNGYQRNFAGDLAEIRIYNRALNDAERTILQYHLAARYGTQLNNDHFAGRDPRYFRALVGLGCALDAGEGHTPGTVAESEWSGGLKLEALPTTLATDGEYLLAAYSATNNVWLENRWSRDWFLVPINSDGIAVKLTFDCVRANIATNTQRNFVLLYRSTSTNDFTVVPNTVLADRATQIDLTVSAGQMREGYYTLGIGTTPQTEIPAPAQYVPGISGGLQAWYRADHLETDPTGAVTNWVNLGWLGSSLNATNVSSGTKPVLIPSALGAYGPAVRIAGGQYLRSCEQTDLGVTREATWFVVYKQLKIDTPIFGLSCDPPRFGAFHTGTAPYPLRAHAFCINGLQYYCWDDSAQTNVYQLADYRRAMLTHTNYSLTLHRNGSAQSAKIATQSDSASGYLGLGKMMEAYTTMDGELAELRIYNRALNDLERLIVQQNMLWRYGLATNTIYFTDIGTPTPAYVLDLIGVGRLQTAFSGLLARSESSAGLTLDVDPAQLTSGDATLLAAHQSAANGWLHPASTQRRAAREWALCKNTQGTLGATLTFTLNATGLVPLDRAEHPAYALFYRATPGETSTPLAVEPTQTGDTVTFVLDDATLQSGLYTLGAAITPRGTILVVR